jgi:hypothetical protein
MKPSDRVWDTLRPFDKVRLDPERAAEECVVMDWEEPDLGPEEPRATDAIEFDEKIYTVPAESVPEWGQAFFTLESEELLKGILPRREWDVLRNRYANGYGPHVLAKVLGMKYNSVMVMLGRAQKRVKEAVEGGYGYLPHREDLVGHPAHNSLASSSEGGARPAWAEWKHNGRREWKGNGVITYGQ